MSGLFVAHARRAPPPAKNPGDATVTFPATEHHRSLVSAKILLGDRCTRTYRNNLPKVLT